MKNAILSLCLVSTLFSAPLSITTDLPAAPELPEIQQPSYKSPLLAVGMSMIYPGLGHLYLGDNQTAGGLIGGATAELVGSASLDPNFSGTFDSLYLNTWFYGIYAVYRDVRLNNRDVGYTYKMPNDSLGDLTAASFRWSVIKKPEVWGGVIGALAAAITIVGLTYPSQEASASQVVHQPLIAFPVGIGEEALFRGVVQPELIDAMNPTAGIATASAFFGLAHMPNAIGMSAVHRRHYYSVSVPFISAFGGYLGWLAHKNGSLQESVAVHAWYDFTLFAIAYLADEPAAMGEPGFSIGIPF